ncbi:dephospho-CoA kinase [Sporocytophaga myxococcoides]|uniref:Dephospho-CoA kinase n=1 Tax=Sporocytophaga myxococcoides TaxID=153721 RepID=A0A098LIY5_9BACT|nr:dephospho-CoA kinase [Sporocytophaga myxococcoides]GAL86905.1 dephospho-CoA kinase [Sporocytophaga myxococcoides]
MKSKQILKIGITGGIGSGKTTVSRVFSVLGIPVYYADDRAKWLMENNSDVIEGISTLFGNTAYSAGKLNRSVISSRAFHNPVLLEQLNAIVHPAVKKDYEDWHLSQRDIPYTLKEAALLFEAGSYKDLDKTILVLSPENLRIRRIIKRDPFRTQKDIKAILERQMKDEEKQNLADFSILNDEVHLIIPQVIKIHRELT